jgi:uncharacterized protein (TIGR02266 family)
MSAERREGERVVINLEFASFEAFVEEFVADVSETGAFIRTRTPRPVGEEIRFRLAVMDRDLETLEGVAVVRRVQDEPRGMAVEFLELAAHSRHVLERLLDHKRR